MEQKKWIGVWTDKCIAGTKDSFKVTEKRGTACLHCFSLLKRKDNYIQYIPKLFLSSPALRLKSESSALG